MAMHGVLWKIGHFDAMWNLQNGPDRFNEMNDLLCRRTGMHCFTDLINASHYVEHADTVSASPRSATSVTV